MDSQAAYWRAYIFLPAKSLSFKGFPISIDLLKFRLLDLLKFRLLYCCYLLFFIGIDTDMCAYVRGKVLFTLLSVLTPGLAAAIKVRDLFTLQFNILHHFSKHGKLSDIYPLLSCLLFKL